MVTTRRRKGNQAKHYLFADMNPINFISQLSLVSKTIHHIMEEYFCISLQTAACWCQLRQIYNRILGFCQDPPESMQRSTTWGNSPFMPSRSHRLLPPTRTQFRIILSLWDSQGIVRNTVSHLFKTPQAQFSLAYHSKLAQVIFICH